MNNIEHAKVALMGPLVKYMPKGQREALSMALRGEEAGGIAEIVLRVLATIEAAPVTYQQDGLGDQAVVHLHYFQGSIDAWITELDMDGGVSQAFGLQCIDGVPGNAEFGYISITELIECSVELDLYFTPKTIADVRSNSNMLARMMWADDAHPNAF